MTAGVFVPVVRHAEVRAWPRPPEAEDQRISRAHYLDLGEALRRPYSSDAHVGQYSVPAVPHRLRGAALPQLADGVPIVAVFLDFDGTDHAATPKWRTDQRRRVEALFADLFADHPGPVAYDTRGGFRIAASLVEPHVIRTAEDADAHSTWYLRQVAALSRRYGLLADPSCADWTRLFRLPHATRDEGGKPQDLPIIGDLGAVGPWTLETNADDEREAARLARERKEQNKLSAQRLRWLRDHARTFSDERGPCEVHPRDGSTCFARLHDDAGKWCCFSTAHPEGVGRFVEDSTPQCYVGDALDLEAFRRGCTITEVLVADGYVKPKQSTTTSASSGSSPGAGPGVQRERKDPAPPRTDQPKRTVTPPLTAEEILRSPAFARPQRTYATGFSYLDRLLAGGIKARQLTTFAAPPGGRKTYLAVQIARRLEPELPILYVTTEVDDGELAARAAAQEMGVSVDEICSLRVAPGDAARYVAGRRIFILFLDGEPESLAIIRAHVIALKQALGVTPLVIVDYLQGLADEASDNLRGQVTAIARGLRRLSQDFDTPAIGVSVTARNYYGPGAKKAKGADDDPIYYLAAAKESGGIESASAVFWYLDVSADVDADGYQLGRACVAKSRRGKPGFAYLKFHGPSCTFEDCTPAEAILGIKREESKVEATVLAWVRDAAQAPTRRQVRDGVRGHAKAEIEAAVARLLDDGRLTEREVKRPDKGGRMQKASVLYLADPVSAPDAGAGTGQHGPQWLPVVDGGGPHPFRDGASTTTGATTAGHHAQETTPPSRQSKKSNGHNPSAGGRP